MGKVIVAMLAALMVGCSSATDATKALQSAGFTDIKTTGHVWFACSDDDTFSTGFIATNPLGKRVEGAVCSSLFVKGSTIRY